MDERDELAGLRRLAELEAKASGGAAPPAASGRGKIDAYLSETDAKLGLPPGTSARQIQQESSFNPQAYNKDSKAAGLAQVIPTTLASLSKRFGRQLDPYNVDDALAMHREVMRENVAKFGAGPDSLRAYNSGWKPEKWNNPETSGYVQNVMGTGRNIAAAGRDLAAGALRGAGSIGATILTPLDYLANKAGIEGAFIGRTDRREAMTGALGDMGADTNSTAFGAGKLGAEVAGTLGTGGALAGAAAAVPRVAAAVPGAINALRTSGFSTGAAPAANFLGRAADMGTRIAAGGTVGGVAAALVDPGSAGTGAAVGAVLPPGIAALGKAGGAVGRVWTKLRNEGNVAGAAALEKALDIASPAERAALVDKLRSAETLVPGSTPTVAQAAMMPQASILERIVGDTRGGNALQLQRVAQGDARNAALEGVAPTMAMGPAMARQDMGAAITSRVVPEERQLSQRIGRMYEEIDPQQQVRLGLPLEEMQAAVDKYLGPGTFGQGGKAREALGAAQKIGTMELPAIAPTTGAAQAESLLDAVKRAGGINQGTITSKSFRGELADLRQGDLGRVVYKARGLDVERMAERMHAKGFIPDEDPATLINYLRENPRNTFAASEGLDARYQAMADHAAGGVPGAETVPRQVPWSEIKNLRSSIGDAWKQAKLDGNKAEAGALDAMKRQVDAAILRAASGDLKPGEVLSPQVAMKWMEANASHAQKMQRFHTGPQASIFRTSPNGEPLVQGGEVAGKFWGARPGVADDVKAFRRLVDDNPAMLGQFRSMIATDGAGTADAAGSLTTKFSKWVRQTLPGLHEAFDPKEVETLRRIAADIDRAAKAAKLGTSLGGSNTYQNAQNALGLGLLDSPAATHAANWIIPVPGVRHLGGMALEGVRGFAKDAKARQLGNLLSDSGRAANALDALTAAQVRAAQSHPGRELLLRNAFRAAPVAASSR